MAKLISPDLVKLLLPLAVAFAKQAAARTPSTFDDALVAVLEKAISDPAILAFILQLLSGDQPTPVSEDEKVIAGSAPAIKKLFDFAGFCHE